VNLAFPIFARFRKEEESTCAVQLLECQLAGKVATTAALRRRWRFVEQKANERLNHVHLIGVVENLNLVRGLSVDQIPIRVVHVQPPTKKPGKSRAPHTRSERLVRAPLQIIKESFDFLFRERRGVAAEAHDHADALFATFSRGHLVRAGACNKDVHVGRYMCHFLASLIPHLDRTSFRSC
jgi:hypothetical protein